MLISAAVRPSLSDLRKPPVSAESLTPPVQPETLKKPPRTALHLMKAAVTTSVAWLDEHSSPRANTAGNLEKPSLFQAAFNGAADGFYVFGLYGIAAGAGSGCAGILAQKLTNKQWVGVVVGTAVGAAAGAAAHYLGAAHFPLVVAAVNGGFIGAFETFRADWCARDRDSGNGAMISAPLMPGTGKLAGGIAGMMAAHMPSTKGRALVGLAAGGALGLLASYSGISHCSFLLAAGISSLAGGLGPFFGPRYSQFFRNVAGDIGAGISKAGNKLGLFKHELKGNVSMALVSIPSSCAKEAVRAAFLSGGSKEAIVFGMIKESIRQFHIFLHMRDETPHLAAAKQAKVAAAGGQARTSSEQPPAVPTQQAEPGIYRLLKVWSLRPKFPKIFSSYCYAVTMINTQQVARHLPRLSAARGGETPPPQTATPKSEVPTDTVQAARPRRALRATIGAGAGAAAGALLAHFAWGGANLLTASLAGAGVGAVLCAVLAKAGSRAPEVAHSIDDIRKLPEFNWKVPTRDEQLARLKDPTQQFDVIVIGGGATGAGTALEAARRGLKTACLESWDFAAGTSSRSTKLIHGGVRYLEKAVKQLDREQYDLVKEGLAERKAFLKMAPHLTGELRLVTPCYKWWEVPYFYVGLSMYDFIAGRENMAATKILSKKATQELLPGIKSDGLSGAVAYSDGQFNDSRMNVSLALTAAASGAAVANYVNVESVVKEKGKIVGVQVQDRRTGDTWIVRGKVVINAAGPYIDTIRQMDDPKTQTLVVPSAGTHIFVKKNLDLPQGILVPKAPNGSVAFFKPFEGGTLIGTTEENTGLTFEPGTTQDQVDYLRGLANHYLNPTHQIEAGDITSVWTGIRPLVRDPKKPVTSKGTENLSRKHIIEVSGAGLVTIGGGKWTSFGRMAQDVVDEAVRRGGLGAGPSARATTRIIGAHGYSAGLAQQLTARFGLEPGVAEHLAHNYGDRAVAVAELAANGLGARLHPDHPYLEAEVVYGARHEYAVDPVDVLSRRTRLSFVDEAATQAVLPKVVTLMAGELGWDADTAAHRLADAQAYYQRNGMSRLHHP